MERGNIEYDRRGAPHWFSDSSGKWWKWGTFAIRKRQGRDWLYWIVNKISSWRN